MTKDNHDGIYYTKVIKSIATTISFVLYIRKRLDKKHGFHPCFIDEHISVSDVMKSDVETLYHLHQRDAERKTRRNWLESFKYRGHYPVDLNWCCSCHRSRASCDSRHFGKIRSCFNEWK